MADSATTAPTPGAQEGGNNQTTAAKQEPKSFTQAEIDAIVEERLAREKKKYADYAELKKAAAELAEIKKSQMTELEKLKAELAEKDKLLQEKDSELSGLKLERVKNATLVKYGIDLEWIDAVAGTTEEEVEASVQKLAKRLKVEPPKAAQGAGSTGIQNQVQNSKKIWKESEIKELRLSGKLTDELMAEIKQATLEGRVQ